MSALARTLGHAIRRQPKQWQPQAAADPIFATMKDHADFNRLIQP